MAPHSSALAWKIHGQRSLVGCSPWGRQESDTTEQLHFHFSLSCTGERNGKPLQCSCLENPRERGAWWAAVSGVAQSRTRLERLSSSSSRLQRKLVIFGALKKLKVTSCSSQKHEQFRSGEHLHLPAGSHSILSNKQCAEIFWGYTNMQILTNTRS